MSLPRKAAVSSRRNSLPVSLNRGMDHALSGYAAAAGAAAVGMMALAQPSEAEVVYTATNKTISDSGTITIDLNNDGMTDFTISATYRSRSFPKSLFQAFYVVPTGQNEVWGAGPFARALPLGSKVGPLDETFVGFAPMDTCLATHTSYRSSGGWRNQSNNYLGLKFAIDGKTHYGWARLTVKLDYYCTHPKATLTGYAYETIPGKAILAGQRSGQEQESLEESSSEPSSPQSPKASLGALALGSAAFVALRRY